MALQPYRQAGLHMARLSIEHGPDSVPYVLVALCEFRQWPDWTDERLLSMYVKEAGRRRRHLPILARSRLNLP